MNGNVGCGECGEEGLGYVVHKPGCIKLNREEEIVMMEEYKKFYEGGEPLTFANTETQFEIGDNVEANGNEYVIYNFYQSQHARKNDVDWLLLKRWEGGVAVCASVHPSEATIISRPTGDRQEAPEE